MLINITSYRTLNTALNLNPFRCNSSFSDMNLLKSHCCLWRQYNFLNECTVDCHWYELYVRGDSLILMVYIKYVCYCFNVNSYGLTNHVEMCIWFNEFKTYVWYRKKLYVSRYFHWRFLLRLHEVTLWDIQSLVCATLW